MRGVSRSGKQLVHTPQQEETASRPAQLEGSVASMPEGETV